ncbi:MAG: L-lysine 6-transaminase [Candidatus Thermoplasmatota archaeon]|nr:L-lysine 6-transaminase [Candidatus Thermoplasmatota archaeon]
MTITPQNVHSTLNKYMLADGLELVLDLRKSHGSRIYNARTNKYMLDCFSFFASAPLGCNHPKLTTPEFMKHLAEVSVNNPTNSDLYTVEMAEFVDAFHHYAVPSTFKHLFFISGGALAIENGLKTAFDWKIRKNFARNTKKETGTQVIHFQEAFHGRTGYTISLTNTFNKNKINYFPKFPWPRIINPKITFPLTKRNETNVQNLEIQAIDEIHTAIKQNPDDIAALIIEPIQGEGGDNHFRPQFMQHLQKICQEQEIMFMVDEIQSGVGITGKMWAYEHHGIKPDILAFGKKTQVCGIMVSPRVDEIPDNVFKVSSRLNSTWGGNLVDMVRCQKYLEIIDEERLIQNAAELGPRIREGLEDIQEKYPNLISNARGSGLMCAFDLPTPQLRDQIREKLYAKDLIILGCGASTIRFRPPLIITESEIDQALTIIKSVVQTMQ